MVLGRTSLDQNDKSLSADEAAWQELSQSAHSARSNPASSSNPKVVRYIELRQ